MSGSSLVGPARFNNPSKAAFCARSSYPLDVGEQVPISGSVTSDNEIRALVLTGRGSAFCAGGDISGMRRRLEAPQGEVAFNGWSRRQGVHRVQSMLPKPTIATVNGAAAGLGADTALWTG